MRRCLRGGGDAPGPNDAAADRGPPRRPGAGTVASVAKAPAVELQVGERTVRISNPDRVYFPATGATKLDLARLLPRRRPGDRQRPAGAAVHAAPLPDRRQRREGPPEAGARLARRRGWRPCGSTSPATACTPTSCASTELADVIWAVQMSTVEFHPWNSRRADVEKPDEWRIDLDPMPDCPLATVRRVAHVVHEVLDELGAVGLAEDVGRQGHARLRPHRAGVRRSRDVRRAALAFAREVERRAPDAVTTTWWRKDRDPAALFVDYNQNARDHTMAAAYSVRGVPEATVSTPITWDEIDDVEPERLHDGDRARSASPSSATCTPASTRRSSPSTSCSSGRPVTSGPAPSTPACRRRSSSRASLRRGRSAPRTRRDPAAARRRRCSPRGGPPSRCRGSAASTGERASSQANATWRGVAPCRSAIVPHAGCRRSPASAPTEGTPRPPARTRRAATPSSVVEVVAVLHRHDRGELLCLAELLLGDVAQADVADLALVLQVDQRADRLLERHRRVGPVELVERDLVEPQPARGCPRTPRGGAPAGRSASTCPGPGAPGRPSSR